MPHPATSATKREAGSPRRFAAGPYAVILLDEIEKAHRDVFNILLQVLDDGRLTDGHGRTVDFRNTVIIMTSNIGSQYISELAGTDEELMRRRVTDALREYFLPEMLNRIDEVIIFHNLGRLEIRSIVRLQIDRLSKQLAESHIEIHVTEAALDAIATEGYDPVYGARPLKRVIQQRIQNPLATELLEGKHPPGSKITIDFVADGFVLSSDREREELS